MKHRFDLEIQNLHIFAIRGRFYQPFAFAHIKIQFWRNNLANFERILQMAVMNLACNLVFCQALTITYLTQLNNDFLHCPLFNWQKR
jgi:hypothetical protein